MHHEDIEKKILAPGSTAHDHKLEFGSAAKIQAAALADDPEPTRNIFRALSRIFIPLMPAFIACGLISGCLNIALKLNPLLAGSPYFQLMAVTGATAFWGLNLFVGMDHMIGRVGAKMIPLDSNFSFNFGLNVAWGGKKKSKKELKTLTFWRMPDAKAQKPAADNTGKKTEGKSQQPTSSGQKATQN